MFTPDFFALFLKDWTTFFRRFAMKFAYLFDRQAQS
jgi:hypothetical protein